MFLHLYMDCAICMEPLDSNIITTNCNHKFHKKCLHKWYDFDKTSQGKYGKCPLCRRDSFDEDEPFNIVPPMHKIIKFNIMRVIQSMNPYHPYYSRNIANDLQN